MSDNEFQGVGGSYIIVGNEQKPYVENELAQEELAKEDVIVTTKKND